MKRKFLNEHLFEKIGIKSTKSIDPFLLKVLEYANPATQKHRELKDFINDQFLPVYKAELMINYNERVLLENRKDPEKLFSYITPLDSSEFTKFFSSSCLGYNYEIEKYKPEIDDLVFGNLKTDESGHRFRRTQYHMVNNHIEITHEFLMDFLYLSRSLGYDNRHIRIDERADNLTIHEAIALASVEEAFHAHQFLNTDLAKWADFYKKISSDEFQKSKIDDKEALKIMYDINFFKKISDIVEVQAGYEVQIASIDLGFRGKGMEFLSPKR